MTSLPPALFITGTGTDAGKTTFAASLYRQRGGVYFKPVQTGPDHDTEAFLRLTGAPREHVRPPVYIFREPVSPHAAAAAEGVRIDPRRLVLPPGPERWIIEGAGGVLVPLTDEFLMVDLMAQLQLPVLVVTRGVLGMINHTLLTLEALAARKLPVCGFAVSGGDRPDDVRTIERISGVPCVAQI